MAVEKKSIAKPVAAAAKTEAPKAEAKKPAAKKPAAKKTAAKKPAAKKADLKSKVVLQFTDREYTEADLVKIAKDVWKYDLNGKASELANVELYVKPEEKKVYYVMNDKEGSFDI